MTRKATPGRTRRSADDPDGCVAECVDGPDCDGLQRTRVDALVTLNPEYGGVEALACDVSETGLKIAVDRPPGIGPITIKLVGMPLFFGQVRWQGARHIGVRPRPPLTSETLPTWIKAHGRRR